MAKFISERRYKFNQAVYSVKSLIKRQPVFSLGLLILLGFVLSGAVNRNVSFMALFDGEGILTIDKVIAVEDDTLPVPSKSFAVQAEAFYTSGDTSKSPNLTSSVLGTVSVTQTQDAAGGYKVGGLDDGDWLAYSFAVPRASTYRLIGRLSRQATNLEEAKFKVKINGENVSGTLSLSDTGGWENWVTKELATVNLETGTHEMTLELVDNNKETDLMDANWFQLVPEGQQPIQEEYVFTPEDTNVLITSNISTTESTQSVSSEPAKAQAFYIEAEDYAPGGQNKSYYDKTSGNAGGEYRNDDVDIETTSDTGGGYNVGWVDSGEWLKYEFNTAVDQKYTVIARLARSQHETTADTYFQLYIDGSKVGDKVTLKDTGGWQSWLNKTVGTLDLKAGSHTLEFKAEGNTLGWGLMNINWFKFVPEGQSPDVPPPSEPVPPPTTPTPPPSEPVPPPTTPTPPPPTTPPPTTGGSDGRVFGSRPVHSGQMVIRNQSNRVIENLHFKNMPYAFDRTNNHVGILIVNSTNITIRNVDFENMSEPIAIFGGGNITVEYTRTRGITGPSSRHGVQTGNFLQTVSGPTNVIIRNNVIYGGDTEDIISLWSASYSVVENNYIDGTGWTSKSGTGIILGDGQGRGNVARNNVLYNPGQVGIAIAGGWDHLVEGNIIYGPQGVPGSNIAAYCSDYSNTFGMSGNAFRNNRAWYWNQGNGATNGFWNPCGAINSGNNWADSSLHSRPPTSPGIY